MITLRINWINLVSEKYKELIENNKFSITNVLSYDEFAQYYEFVL